MEIYRTYERGSERHHGICDHCGTKTIYPYAKNPYIFFGFQCMDTGMFISNDCKQDFYTKKNYGEYGAEHSNKYSEMIVPVPWLQFPYKEDLQLELF